MLKVRGMSQENITKWTEFCDVSQFVVKTVDKFLEARDPYKDVPTEEQERESVREFMMSVLQKIYDNAITPPPQTLATIAEISMTGALYTGIYIHGIAGFQEYVDGQFAPKSQTPKITPKLKDAEMILGINMVRCLRMWMYPGKYERWIEFGLLYRNLFSMIDAFIEANGSQPRFVDLLHIIPGILAEQFLQSEYAKLCKDPTATQVDEHIFDQYKRAIIRVCNAAYTEGIHKFQEHINELFAV